MNCAQERAECLDKAISALFECHAQLPPSQLAGEGVAPQRAPRRASRPCASGDAPTLPWELGDGNLAVKAWRCGTLCPGQPRTVPNCGGTGAVRPSSPRNGSSSLLLCEYLQNFSSSCSDSCRDVEGNNLPLHRCCEALDAVSDH